MASASALQEPVIDRQALDRHTMGNAALQQELFILFFDQMPVYLDQLDEAVSSNDHGSPSCLQSARPKHLKALRFQNFAKSSKRHAKASKKPNQPI